MAGERAGSAWYELGAEDEQLRRALDEAENRIRASGRTADDSFGRQASGAMNTFGDSVNRSTGFLRQAAATAAGFIAAQASIHLVSRGWDTIKNAIFGTNAQLETSTLQFETLMGSAEEAQAHVRSLFEFAKATPFETGPIIEASRMMQTFGGATLNTTRNLTLVGDAAAAVAAPIEELGFWVGRAYSNIQAGRPFGEAAMRLQELAVMSPQARAEMERLQAAGASADEVWRVFEEDLGRFTGAMERQAGTWEGLTSTFTDTLNLTIANALKPFFDFAKEGLSGLNTMLGSEGVQAAITGFGATATSVFAGAVDAIRGVAGAVGEWVGQNGPLISQIAEYAASGFGAFVDIVRGFAGIAAGIAGQIAAWVDAQRPLLEQLATMGASSFVRGLELLGDALMYLGSQEVVLAIGAITLGVWAFKVALDAIRAHPVIGGIALIAAAVGLFAQAWENNWGRIRDTLIEAWPAIREVLDAVYVAGQWLERGISIALMGIELAWEELVGATQRAAEVLLGVMATIPGPMQETYRKAHESLQGMADDTEARADDIEAEMARIAQAPLDHLPRWTLGVDGFRLAVEGVIDPTIDAARRLASGVLVPLLDIDLYQSGADAVATFAAGITENQWRAQSAMAGVAQVTRDIMPGSEPRDPSSPFRGITTWGDKAARIIIDGWRRAIPYARHISSEFSQALVPGSPGGLAPLAVAAGAGMGGAGSAGGGQVVQVYYTHAPMISVASERETEAAMRTITTLATDGQQRRGLIALQPAMD